MVSLWLHPFSNLSRAWQLDLDLKAIVTLTFPMS